MPSLETALIFALLIIIVPFLVVQMQVALAQKDGEAFYLWICLGCLVAAFGFVV